MQSTTLAWDRHAILAEIKRRYGTLKAFAEKTPLSADHFSVALKQPYPRADRLIARALNVPVHELWPDRYYASGRRRSSSRAARRRASQKPFRARDTGERS